VNRLCFCIRLVTLYKTAHHLTAAVLVALFWWCMWWPDNHCAVTQVRSVRRTSATISLAPRTLACKVPPFAGAIRTADLHGLHLPNSKLTLNTYPYYLLIIQMSFMFCWPCISIYACNETSLRHYLSSIYSVTIPQHVSGLLVAHHPEVTMYKYICNKWYVLYVLVYCQLAWSSLLMGN
jgi:hypothetical protein